MQRETSQDIDDQAARWVASMDRAPLSTDDAGRLEAWLAGDARRRGALLRARAAMLAAEATVALGPDFDPDTFRASPAASPAPIPARRKPPRGTLAWAAALVAMLAIATLLPLTDPGSVAYATERGEMRRVPLGDGSTMTLNTSTRVRVHRGRDQRRVTLLEGEAWFEVAQDAGHPLVVEVDGRRLSTTGGAFVVRKLARAPVAIVVGDGRVDLPGSPTAVRANQRVLLPTGGGDAAFGRVSDEVLTRELAWRQGQIAFHGESLAEASAAFARYSGTPVVIADATLAREQVTGLFSAHDPAGFGRAVTRMFDARMDETASEIRVTRQH